MSPVPSAPTRRGFLATSAAGLLQVNSYLSPSTNTRLHRSNDMPLARIDLIKGKPSDYRRTIGNVVYRAMVENLKAPENDRFQVINEHDADNFVYDPNQRLKLRREDVFISLVGTGRDDWSFGNGESSLVKP